MMMVFAPGIQSVARCVDSLHRKHANQQPNPLHSHARLVATFLCTLALHDEKLPNSQFPRYATF